MFQFPEEAEQSRRIRHNLEREFEYANRVCRFWLEFEKDRWLAKSNLPEDVLHLAMALHTQACRQMRSVMEECARCEAFGANIAARGLFETALAMVFILKPKVHIVVRPVLDRNGAQKLLPDGTPKYSAAPPSRRNPKRASNLLQRELRAYLYLANIAFSERALARKCATIHGLKGFGRWFAKRVEPAIVAHCENLIGPEWTSILRQSTGYSGLSVSELAQLLHRKLFHWYSIVYAIQSSMHHGANALLHTREIAERTIGSAFLSTETEVSGALQCGVTLFRICMAFMQNEIGFGRGAETAMWHFLKEFHEIYG